MKRLKRFDNYIKESYLESSRSPLYHSTSVWNAKDILDQNIIIAAEDYLKRKNRISFSRNPTYVYMDNPVTLVINANKLSHNYKITPFDWLSKAAEPKSGPNRSNFEFEEVVSKNIPQLDKYLIEVRINEAIDRYRNAKMNTRTELRESYEDLIKSIIDYKTLHTIKVFFKGKEVDEDFLKKELMPL